MNWKSTKKRIRTEDKAEEKEVKKQLEAKQLENLSRKPEISQIHTQNTCKTDSKDINEIMALIETLLLLQLVISVMMINTSSSNNANKKK